VTPEPGLDRAALAALADKYETLVAWRRRRDAGDATPPGALRALAARFPGALRELDTLGEAALADRARACRAAAASTGPIEPWMRWIAAYHDLLGAALALKRAAGSRRAPRRDPDATPADTTPAGPPTAPAGTAEAGNAPLERARAAGLPDGNEALAAILRPPGGRLAPLVLRWVARQAGVPAAQLQRALFPPRRPSPYTLEE
jgi:hypothetical protein